MGVFLHQRFKMPSDNKILCVEVISIFRKKLDDLTVNIKTFSPIRHCPFTVDKLGPNNHIHNSSFSVVSNGKIIFCTVCPLFGDSTIQNSKWILREYNEKAQEWRQILEDKMSPLNSTPELIFGCWLGEDFFLKNYNGTRMQFL